jgi:hypothetical protein
MNPEFRPFRKINLGTVVSHKHYSVRNIFFETPCEREMSWAEGKSEFHVAQWFDKFIEEISEFYFGQ